MNSDMSQSNKVMEDIKKQRRVNRCMLYGVIALIAISLIAIVAVKLIL
jgi:hypothetical protein